MSPLNDREHTRIPYSVEVQYRTASSFLIAYSTNLSRGGLFLESESEVPLGTPIELRLFVPGVGAIDVQGAVSWRRERNDPEGPAGYGIEFQELGATLGQTIDRLVANYDGLSILILCGDRHDRSSLARAIRSILSTADVVSAADARVAETLLTAEVDLAVIDTDHDPEGALLALRAAHHVTPPVPTIALASTKRLRERARAAGADEVGSNPPPFGELQLLIVRALGRPSSIK